MYIADADNYRIQLWRSSASSGITVAGSGVPGTALHQLSVSYGITMVQENNALYVADHGNARVMSYQSGNTTGSLVFGGNGNGNSANQVHGIIGIHFDAPSNSFLILNRDSHNLVRWKLGESHWTIVAGSAGGASGNNSTAFYRPHGFTVDPMGNIYIADTDNHRIQFFPVGQSSAMTIAGITGRIASDNSSFDRCFSVALDNQLNLYVSDYNNHRVQKFLRY